MECNISSFSTLIILLIHFMKSHVLLEPSILLAIVVAHTFNLRAFVRHKQVKLCFQGKHDLHRNSGTCKYIYWVLFYKFLFKFSYFISITNKNTVNKYLLVKNSCVLRILDDIYPSWVAHNVFMSWFPEETKCQALSLCAHTAIENHYSI